MSLFSNILQKIFPSTPASPAQTQAAPTASNTQVPSGAVATGPATTAPQAVAPTGASQLDAEQVLSDLAAKNPEKLNWRTSIVDLLKLLDLDSSLAARKALATELHFAGDQGDSATMNVWLHQEVLKKLAANGGKVPAELKD